MKKSYLILDCYVDEPACFGVPPFLSPYPRYIYGALIDAGIDHSAITYETIDTVRSSDYRIENIYELVFLVGGAVVPGKYLGAKIGTLSEIRKITGTNKHLSFAIGGLISHVIHERAENVISIKKDIEKFAYLHGKGSPADNLRTVEEISRWAETGAAVVSQHPDYPDIICEIESYRGCPRSEHCSFCSEGLMEAIDFRDGKDILREIATLIKTGISRFRLGRQPDILQYKTNFSFWKNGFPRPDPEPIIEIFKELKKYRLNGDIAVLNIDNANPGTIAQFPEESSKILEVITDAITPGDTLALGIESFDPAVMRLNNLKVTPEETLKVIEIINAIGGRRVDGIPVLLPGINLIHGLRGETGNTFEINYRNLRSIRDCGLLIKRINIRKVNPFPGTDIFSNTPAVSKKVHNRFEYYRDKIRHEIDHEMLKIIYPAGTVLRDCMILQYSSGYSLGKQISSYSITAKLPLKLDMKKFYDVIVLGHRERSLSALTSPIDINSIPHKAIELIPGIGKKTAGDIILNRPFNDKGKLHTILQGVNNSIKDKIIFRKE